MAKKQDGKPALLACLSAIVLFISDRSQLFIHLDSGVSMMQGQATGSAANGRVSGGTSARAFPPGLVAWSWQVWGSPKAQKVEEVQMIPAVQPVPRVLVPSLTEDLLATLQRHNIQMLYVLGPATDQSIRKRALHRQCTVHFVQSPRELARLAAEGVVGGGPGSPRSALLFRSYDDGKVDRRVMQLSVSISAMMGPLHVATFVHTSRLGGGNMLVAYNRMGYPFRAAFPTLRRFRDLFDGIYRQRTWSSEGGGSGPGSALYSTIVLRETLPSLIHKYGIKSMLDSSCGSMHWLPLVLENVTQSMPEFQFMGTDVVCGLTEAHKQTFKKHQNWKFSCLDFVNELLPSGYDLVLSRDSLQHLPLDAVWMFLNNVKASGARYLLVGSYIQSEVPNFDVAAGGLYPVDLTKPPFLAQSPIEVIDEKVAIPGYHKFMLLFDMATMTWQDPLVVEVE